VLQITVGDSLDSEYRGHPSPLVPASLLVTAVDVILAKPHYIVGVEISRCGRSSVRKLHEAAGKSEPRIQ